MTTKRNDLPQLDGGLFLTDGGIETTLIFHDGLDQPYFASYDLLRNQEGTEVLRRYFKRYAELARDNDIGIILESPTWRASADWGVKMGYSDEALAVVNKESLELLAEVRDEYETDTAPIVLSGCIGPRGDGYDPGNVMSPEQAEAYHAKQVNAFRDSKADMICALTMTNVNEALGVTRAAQAAGMPVAISFTVETDGKLPTGQDLGEAVEAVDAATGNGPAYFMINCAHPDHFQHVLESGEPWLQRLQGLRCNASRMSHEELDNAEELDDGNPVEFGEQFGDIHRHNPQINVLGGCCGTDHRHIEHVCHSSKLAAQYPALHGLLSPGPSD
jgi:S-methylmethionine-dependent homocysteine/selenocysteine methylase